MLALTQVNAAANQRQPTMKIGMAVLQAAFWLDPGEAQTASIRPRSPRFINPDQGWESTPC
jgi:hypothetical protein